MSAVGALFLFLGILIYTLLAEGMSTRKQNERLVGWWHQYLVTHGTLISLDLFTDFLLVLLLLWLT